MRLLGGVGRLFRFGLLAGVALVGMNVSTAGTAEAAKNTSQAQQRARSAGTTQHMARPLAASSRTVAAHVARPGAKQAVNPKNGKSVMAARGYGGLQCVPFARNASGIALSGNAWQWWDNAAGLYGRGNAPEEGAILSFKSNGSMRLGHVAVVSRVVNARQIEIDHANWAGPGGRKGAVTRGASVVDVSDNNDWTAVRVELGASERFGSIYPTNGFIYDRPDRGGVTQVAAARPAPMPDLEPAPRDLRTTGQKGDGYASVSYAGGFVEVAEAPATRPTTRARKPARTRH